MKVLVVYAHPEPQSFCAALLRAGKEALESVGHQVVVSDLYAMGFSPIASREDFLEVADPDFFKYQREQQHAAAREAFAADIAAEQRKLVEADFVILHFPLWWFGTPAIMKGWFDRVLALDFAYGGGRWFEYGPLRGRRAMLTMTAGAPRSRYSSGAILGAIERTLFPIHVGVLNLVGLAVLEPFVAWAPVRMSEAERSSCLEAYRQRLRSIESEPALPFHSIADNPDPLLR